MRQPPRFPVHLDGAGEGGFAVLALGVEYHAFAIGGAAGDLHFAWGHGLEHGDAFGEIRLGALRFHHLGALGLHQREQGIDVAGAHRRGRREVGLGRFATVGRQGRALGCLQQLRVETGIDGHVVGEEGVEVMHVAGNAIAATHQGAHATGARPAELDVLAVGAHLEAAGHVAVAIGHQHHAVRAVAQCVLDHVGGIAGFAQRLQIDRLLQQGNHVVLGHVLVDEHVRHRRREAIVRGLLVAVGIRILA
jgi:hypothetical protein